MRLVRTLVCHHSATATGNVETFRREHRARGYSDVGYHGVILPDGVYERGRNEELVGAAVFGANTGLLHVCLVGQFDKGSPGFTGSPAREQLDTLGWWLLKYSWQYTDRFSRPPLEVAGHREKALPTHPTVCPGSEFPIEAVRRWFGHYVALWRPGAAPELSLGAFVKRGGALSLLDEATRPAETPKRLTVLFADGLSTLELPRDDWEIRQGQTWVRLRPFCEVLGAEVEATDKGVLVRARA